MNNGKLLIASSEILKKIAGWFVIIATIFLAVAMTIGVIDVIGTKFFNWPLPIMKELTEELFVGMVFLGMAFVELDIGHLRITIFESRIPGKFQYAISIFKYFLAVFLTGFISWRTFIQLKYTITHGIVKAAVINIPEWPGGSMVFIGFLLLFLVYFSLLLRCIAMGPEKYTAMQHDS
jgi:TRAP-type C4-dicarboxylate transport system permease small subunit